MEKVTAKNIHEYTSSLRVYLFNVGQGDHIMLKFPTGEYGIIDFHFDGNNIGTCPPVLTYFKKLKDELTPAEFQKITIAFFCISHTDKDHVKGIVKTIKWFCDNGVYIRDIWLGATRDEQQLYGVLKEKINALITQLPFLEQRQYYESINLFAKQRDLFFAYFEKWKERKVFNRRYAEEGAGTGEYLQDIRPLKKPSKSSEAINMGPLGAQLDAYYSSLTVEVAKHILGVEDNSKVDKNLLSHILKIRFGERNLLFGGDTHLDIWTRCLDEYERNEMAKYFGDYKSHFIKVSHHGSRNSSSPELWKRIIPCDDPVFLGISAGQNKKYKHPHSETITHIRSVRQELKIMTTNLCSGCLLRNEEYEQEWHEWYDAHISAERNYRRKDTTHEDDIINQGLSSSRFPVSPETVEKDFGLLAYIFDIPEKTEDKITMKMALSKGIRQNICFFNDREEKLWEKCVPIRETGECSQQGVEEVS
jgi:beta-lactamase superfamily II metal-dependent hydrolase